MGRTANTRPPGANSKPRPYNPLEKRRLAESIVLELLRHEPGPLPPAQTFPGAGVYLLYYRGTFTAYRELGRRNAEDPVLPIYVGKAVPQGGRKGSDFSDEPCTTPVLHRRLVEHAESVSAADNLALADFACRYLVVDDIWIRLAESLLIDRFRPLWNVVVDGFGNHDPGAGRHRGKRSNWDTLHPGRKWAARLQPGKLSLKQIADQVRAYMSQLGPTP